jgi:hypothetical protein
VRELIFEVRGKPMATQGLQVWDIHETVRSSDLYSVTVVQRLVRQRGLRRRGIDNPERDA